MALQALVNNLIYYGGQQAAARFGWNSSSRSLQPALLDRGLSSAIIEGDEGQVMRLLRACPSLLNAAVPVALAQVQGLGVGGLVTYIPLTLAVQEGQLGVVRKLVQAGADVNAAEDNGETALHKAAGRGHGDMVVFLLSHGAQVHRMDGLCNTPLMAACRAGFLPVVRTLVWCQNCQGLEASDTSGRTALFMAAEGGHEEVVAFLLDCGARSSRKSASGRTPLMAAASGGGFLRVVRTLLEHQKGQGLDLRDSRGETALYKAAKAGHADMVYFLLIRGARADLSDQSRNTPLMAACSSGFLGVVRTLLEHQEGQGLDSKDAEGRTALFKAAENGHEEVVVFLLSRGAQANIERRRWEGNTPLMAAYNDGFLGVVRVIIHHLMDEGLVVVGGTNALHIAVERGDEEIVGLLLACGADVSGAIRTVSSAKTALGIASEKGRLSVVKLLLEHLNGQRLDTRDGNGSTALHLACQNDTPEVVRALLVAGADPTIRNNFGQTPRAIAEQSRHSRCARAFPWWQGQCRAHLYRARSVHDAITRLRQERTASVPAYLNNRVATRRALPTVRVVPPQSTVPCGGGARLKREVDDEETEERHALLEFVVRDLNEQLFTELLDGLHLADIWYDDD